MPTEAETVSGTRADVPGVVLASRSERRCRLLEQFGVPWRVVDPGVDDARLGPPRGDIGAWVMAMAYLKAAAGAEALHASPASGIGAATIWAGKTPQRWVILGADTVCVRGREVFGQPRDADEAARMLRTLEQGEHDVITGAALVWDAGEPGTDAHTAANILLPGHRAGRWLLLDRARVRVGRIGEARLRRYIDSGAWCGKAGAYNLAERLDAGWPMHVLGDPTTVMGLPMRRLLVVLRCVGRAGRHGTEEHDHAEPESGTA